MKQDLLDVTCGFILSVYCLEIHIWRYMSCNNNLWTILKLATFISDIFVYICTHKFTTAVLIANFTYDIKI